MGLDDLVGSFPDAAPVLVDDRIVEWSFDDIDLAKVGPCPICGEPVRRFSAVPIAGSGLDLVFAGPWWCADCLAIKTITAAAGIVPPVTTTKENP